MPTKKVSTDKPVAAKRDAEEKPVASPCSVVLQQPAPKETVCDVCGHVNRGETMICEMCSNYLFK